MKQSFSLTPTPCKLLIMRRKYFNHYFGCRQHILSWWFLTEPSQQKIATNSQRVGQRCANSHQYFIYQGLHFCLYFNNDKISMVLDMIFCSCPEIHSAEQFTSENCCKTQIPNHKKTYQLTSTCQPKYTSSPITTRARGTQMGLIKSTQVG